MELAWICAQQVAVLFLLIGAGALGVKMGWLKAEGRQMLSSLLVNLVVPAMIVNSYRMEFSMEILRNLLAAFGLSVLAILMGTVLTLLLTARQKDSRAPIFRFACVFSNASGRGTPIAMGRSSLLRSNKVLFSIPHLWAFINPAKGEEIEKGCSVFGKRSCSVRSFCTLSDILPAISTTKQKRTLILIESTCVCRIGVARLELAASCSQSRRATNCATPRHLAAQLHRQNIVYRFLRGSSIQNPQLGALVLFDFFSQ